MQCGWSPVVVVNTVVPFAYHVLPQGATTQPPIASTALPQLSQPAPQPLPSIAKVVVSYAPAQQAGVPGQ